MNTLSVRMGSGLGLLAGAVTVAALALAAGGCGATGAPTAVTDSGAVRGFARGGIDAFLGIPYATAPVGDLRWRPPRLAPVWTGTRDCIAFGSKCLQPTGLSSDGSVTGLTGSEDCLYLNLWRPEKIETGQRLPVMVFIHGGAFVLGQGSGKMYDGKHLAAKGVIVVTFNYRLGPFGFLALPALAQESPEGSTGNYGLLDQVAALQWVQRNIAAFGGDPGNVTMFGESAGGVSVMELMVSPLAQGLFHKVIGESALFLDRGLLMKAAQSRDEAYGIGRQFAQALGCEDAADPAAALRAKDAADLFSYPPAYREMLGWTVPYVPVIDGYVLAEAPGTIFAEGRQPAVPLIVGSNASEGNLFTAGVNPPPASAKSTKPKLLPSVTLSAEGYRAAIALMYAEFAPAVLAMFPAATDEAVAPALSSLFTLMSFTSAARFAADAMVAKTPSVYVYRFSRFPPLFKLGACHGIEVPYVFGTLVDKAALDEGGLAGLKLHWLMLEQAALDLAVGTFDRRDHNASKALLGYWTNFAKTGDPNGPGLVEWQAFDAQTAPYLEVGDAIGVEYGLDDAGCALAERIWSAGLPLPAPAVPEVTGG